MTKIELGQAVVVTGGPFKGLQGQVNEMSNLSTVRVFLSFMPGGPALVAFKTDLLEVIEKPKQEAAS